MASCTIFHQSHKKLTDRCPVRGFPTRKIYHLARKMGCSISYRSRLNAGCLIDRKQATEFASIGACLVNTVSLGAEPRHDSKCHLTLRPWMSSLVRLKNAPVLSGDEQSISSSRDKKRHSQRNRAARLHQPPLLRPCNREGVVTLGRSCGPDSYSHSSSLQSTHAISAKDRG